MLYNLKLDGWNDDDSLIKFFQEVFGSPPTESSLKHAPSREVSSMTEGNEGHLTVKGLTEKLSAALLEVEAKDDLIKQHAKVTEEAISGKLGKLHPPLRNS